MEKVTEKMNQKSINSVTKGAPVEIVQGIQDLETTTDRDSKTQGKRENEGVSLNA